MERSGFIQRVQLTNKASQGTNGDTLYYHRLWMDNGDEGKIALCTEPTPSWLREGLQFTYTIKQGQWGDLFYRANGNNSQSHGQTHNVRRNNHQPESNEELQALIHPDFRKEVQKAKVENPVRKNSYGSRLEDQLEYWLIKQNFIASITCVERATEMLNSGTIKKEEFQIRVREMFDLIMDLSGLKKINTNESIISDPADVTDKTKSYTTPSKKSDKSQNSAPKLFANEEFSTMIPEYIHESINACDSAAKLLKLEKQLHVDELTIAVKNAIETKRISLKTKK